MSAGDIAFTLTVVAAFTLVEAWYKQSRVLARGACLLASAGIVFGLVAR